MADVPSITMVQRFTYRDVAEEFSNRYHFSGDVPSTGGEWDTLIDGLKGKLHSIYKGSVEFVRAYGYAKDGEDAAYILDYEDGHHTVSTGTLITTDALAPGDAAMMCSWDTGRRNSRGKKIYLRKYFHGVTINAMDQDKVGSAQLSALGAFATALLTDIGDGTRTIVGPDGEAPGTATASQWITTRTLKRRGKRPPS